MSEPPGRSLLSQWIKPPTKPDQISGLSSENQVTLSSQPADRKRSAELWSDIFRKPETKVTKHEKDDAQKDTSISQNDEQELPTRPAHHYNPRNPFSSYVVSLKFPKHLRDALENRSLSTEESDKSSDPGTNGTLDSSKTNTEAASFAQPSHIHVFRLPSEQLRALQPKPHPFFAKRKTSGSVSKPSSSPSLPGSRASSLRPISRSLPPWETVHVRPSRSWKHTNLSARARTELCVLNGTNTPCMGDLSLVPQIHIPHQIHKPQRILASSAQVIAMAEHSQPQSEGNRDLFEVVGDLKPFDVGQFESRMWCDIYAPRRWQSHVTPEVTKEITDWLAEQFKARSKGVQERRQHRPSRRKTPGYSMDDGFVVDDTDEDEKQSNDVLVVCGPSGSGKTSAVYSAAQSLDAFVFEVSTAVKRTGKEVANMLDGISQNHAVHKAKNVVILIDDADIIYENEASGFWSTISKFAVTSRRPVILTCTNERLIALSGVASRTVYMPRPNLVRVTDLVGLIALSEGHIIDLLKLARLVVAWNGDIRRVLAQIQFWCQMGVGGSPSGDEWVAREYEMKEQKADRVLSKGTWFPDPPSYADLNETGDENKFDFIRSHRHKIDNNRANDPNWMDASHISSAANVADLESLSDLWDPRPEFNSQRPSQEETVWGNGELVMPEWNEPVVVPYRGNEPALHNVFQMESSYGTSSKIIGCDISPFMRLMVASDYQRMLVMKQALANMSDREVRMTRRLWANSGIDSRQYLELSKRSMDIVLSTGYPVNYLK